MASSPTFVTELLALVRQRAYLPVTGGPTDAAIVRDLNAELLTYVTPLLVGTGDERFVTPYEFTTTTGEGEYDIPTTSIGGDFRDIQVRTSTNPDVWFSLPHTEPERAVLFQTSATYPLAYYIQDNAIILVPIPAGGTVMRFKEYLRPRQIVSTGYSTATNVAAGATYTITVDSTSGMETGDFDILDPTTYARLSESLPGTVASSTTLTFLASALTSAQLTALAASDGDVFVQHGTAPCADIPQEAAILLALRAAAIQWQEQTDPRAAQTLAEIERVRKTILALFQPRTGGLPRKVVNFSGPGWGSRRWGYYYGSGSGV